MREEPVLVEESRLIGIDTIDDYQWFKERHRIFPAVFENRNHQRILESSAGVGCLARRVRDNYPSELICNDISPTCLKVLNKMGLKTLSFDLDNPKTSFPFPDSYFDAVVSMVTIEHLYNVDYFIREIKRILTEDGYLYISTPNYAAPEYLHHLVVQGETYHDPLIEDSKYEFYAHIRYFTHKTLVQFVSSFGLSLDTIYLALPEGSTAYRNLYSSSRIKALTYRYARWGMFKFLPISWAPEPIYCFKNGAFPDKHSIRKVIL